MNFADDYENEDSLIDHLASELNHGRLALVLGAGISKPFGLPDWEELIDRMFAAKAITREKSESLLNQAEYLKSTVFPRDLGGFLQLTHDCLYQSCDITFEKLRQNETLSAIGALVMSSRRGNVAEILTFNYDNLLELYLSFHGFVCHSISSEKHWRVASDIAILHPHGYLPAHKPTEFSANIVLDTESYSSIVGDQANVWFQSSMSILRHKTPIFIGISGDDSNLDAMLVRSRDGHPATQENWAYFGIAIGKDVSATKRTKWEQRKIFVKELSNYSELPSLLFRICQRAAEKRKT